MSGRSRFLVVGLGNPMAGDDGVGSHIARRLAEDARLPAEADVVEGGTDLLRLAQELDGRPWVILIDALLDPGEPGTVLQFHGELDEVETRGAGVHPLSPLQALRLLRCLYPALRAVPTSFLGITISDVRISHELSPILAAKLDGLVETVLGVLTNQALLARAVDSPGA